MHTAPPCSRAIGLLLLPFVLLFSVLYLVNPSTPNGSTSSPISSTSTQSSLVFSSSLSLSKKPGIKKTARPCRLYAAPDSRPFFEREPPQTNLPQRVTNSSRQDLLQKLRSLKLVTVACAYNVENHVDKFRKHIEPIVDLFHPLSRIIIVESDSTDNTLSKLHQWPRPEVYTYGNLSVPIQSRTDRIAYCRNELLHKARQLNPDYMLVVDLDIFAVNISSFLTNFDYNPDDWSVMTANLIHSYYDLWALRTLSESVLNFDVWHRVWAIGYVIEEFCLESVLEQVITVHQKPYPIERGLLEVRSAFDGAALYKMKATDGCEYSGDPLTCEHVPFHQCMRDKSQARIFINPHFRNAIINTNPV